MDTIILKFVLFFAKTFLKKDVDFEQLKIITSTKILMDRRRIRVSMKQKPSKKEPKNQILVSQIIYAILGIFVGAIIFYTKDLITSMILIHSYILFMMAMTLITDFSTVLLDTTDNQIILPRPVSSKTFFISRLVHILVYLLQFTVALSLFPIIFSCIQFGILVGIATIVTVLLSVAMAVFFTYLLYGLILKISTEQKIREVINWFQIVLTIFFAVGYQIIPRLIDFNNLSIGNTIHWYSYFIPPYWMAYTLQTIQQLTLNKTHIIMLLLACIVPVFTFWIMIKFLAPSFSKKIASMGNASTQQNIHGNLIIEQKKTLVDNLSAKICSNKTEQSGFELTWKMMARDKSFKVQFYPSLAYILVFAFIFVFNRGENISEIWAKLNTTKMYLWFVYLPMFTITSAIALIATNENFAASWIYLSSPLQQPGSLISGGLKAILAKFFIPIFIVLFAFGLYIWQLPIIDDFLLGFFNNILIFLIISHLGKSYLPFSMQPNVKMQTGKFVKLILQVCIISVLVGLHYLATNVPWLVVAVIPFSIFSCYWLFKTIQQYNWSKIAS